jgi:hypothetical protein
VRTTDETVSWAVLSPGRVTRRRPGGHGLQQSAREVDPGQVRASIVVYGVLYVVMEMIGHQLEQVGWSQVSALDVATAVTDAFLTVAICGAVLLALELGARRWQRSRRARAADEVQWDAGPIEVTSWRPELEAPPSPASSGGGTYGGNPYTFAGHRYPKDDGRLL